MMEKKIHWEILAIYVGIAFFAVFIIFRQFPGIKNMVFGNSQSKKAEIAEKKEKRQIDFSKIKSDNPVDFSFLKEMESEKYPTLRQAFHKRHYNARIEYYNTSHLRLHHRIVIDDFYASNRKEEPLFVRYSYVYTSEEGDKISGTADYCASIYRDANLRYHLVLEARKNNIQNCMFRNKNATFDYVFVPSQTELGESRNRIESKIKESLRNKDLSEMTEDEIRQLERY